jgi:hypothetical protein
LQSLADGDLGRDVVGCLLLIPFSGSAKACDIG